MTALYSFWPGCRMLCQPPHWRRRLHLTAHRLSSAISSPSLFDHLANCILSYSPAFHALSLTCFLSAAPRRLSVYLLALSYSRTSSSASSHIHPHTSNLATFLHSSSSTVNLPVDHNYNRLPSRLSSLLSPFIASALKHSSTGSSQLRILNSFSLPQRVEMFDSHDRVHLFLHSWLPGR